MIFSLAPAITSLSVLFFFVTCNHVDELLDEYFVLIDFQHFCKVPNPNAASLSERAFSYMPAEVALLLFNLRRGVKNEINFLMKCSILFIASLFKIIIPNLVIRHLLPICSVSSAGISVRVQRRECVLLVSCNI